MSKHESLPKPSLFERAAQVYDFAAAMRANAPVVPADEIAPRPVQPEPIPGEGRGPVSEGPQLGPGLRRGTAREIVKPTPFRGRTGAADREQLAEAGFVLPDTPVSALAEELRIVKRQILLAAMGGAEPAVENGRLILVCSAQPNEGKTFCAVNLALSMASEKDVEVLLVDADVAKPEILSTLGLEGGDGFMDAIADPAVDVERCIIRTDIGNLHVLPAGRATHDDTELIASDRTRAVLDILAAKPNRIVIFDSPPALAASAASELALHAGQVVMVVRADRTSENELRDAIGLLGGCDNIRLLLNGVTYGGAIRRFGSYYGYGE